MRRRGCAALLLALAGCAGAAAHPPPPAPPAAAVRTPVEEWPLTRAERSGFLETSRYDEVVGFLEALDRRSGELHLTRFGYSHEGRALPLAVWGAPATTPEAVRSTGRTRVFVQANIHAGEVEGKEAMQILLRELARGEHARWADSLVLLVAPVYNADGNERVNLSNRPRQHGPFGGMGQRANAQGYDLNRDHMKLDTPEAHALARLFREYDPHVAVDLHATNGTYHAYHLTYAPPLHPSTDAGIVEHLRGRWLPEVTRLLERERGMLLQYYGNVPQRESLWAAPEGAERGWYSFDHRPRFNNNYVGLRNRYAILSEAYAYLTFEERVEATRHFVVALLDHAHANASEIRTTTAAADARPLVGQRLAVRAGFRRADEPIEILMGSVREERNPFSGERVLRREETVRRERMADYSTFEARETETVPAAYLVPAGLERVVAKLEAHGIAMRRAEEDAVLEVERFRITGSTRAERPFERHQERTITGAYERARLRVPAGTLVVPMDQPLARLAFHLLEPRSDDGLVNWNVLDEALEGAEVYPVLRVPAGGAGRP